MEKLISFHGKEAVKKKYLDRVIAHRKADRIIQGIGWDNGKGCAVGCTLEDYDHSLYPVELGLPVWLAKLEDRIFEGLQKNDAMTWPEKFLNAIPVGSSLEFAQNKLSIKRLDRLILIQKSNMEKIEKNKNFEDMLISVIASLEHMKKCHESHINGSYCDWEKERAAADSAEESARAVAESARAAAESARAAAESAEEPAQSAAWAARAAAESARAAAESAAESAEEPAQSAAWAARAAAWAARAAAWKQESEDLLEVLSKS